MKIQVNNTDLLRALGHIQSIVEKRNVKSILSNVKINTRKNQLSFYTTDLDIFAKETMEAHVGGESTTTTPIHIFYDIVRKIGGDKEIQIIFEPSDKPVKMLIKSGHSEFNLPCISGEEFPDFEEGKHDSEFNVSSDNLYYLISTTKHAISQNDVRYYLNGIFLHVVEENSIKVLRSVATDVHRLALSEITLPENVVLLPEIIIPKKVVFELVKLLKEHHGQVHVGVSPNKITVKMGSTTIISKLIDGKFPDYNKAIPYGNSKLLKVSTEELTKAVDLVTTVSTEEIRAVKLRIQKSKVTLSVHDKMNSSSIMEIPANYEDEEVQIAFNAKYILDILSNIAGEEVCFKINSNNTAILVEDSANSNCKFVLMPMQV